MFKVQHAANCRTHSSPVGVRLFKEWQARDAGADRLLFAWTDAMAGVFDERAPLLLSDRAEKWVGVASGSDGDGADPKGQRPLAELIFLASVLRPYGALWLTVLSVLESGVTAASGMMYGRFYQAFIDRDAGLFLRTLLFAGLLFAMSAAIAATTDFAAEFLSNRWRWRLGFAAQHQYCRGRGLLRAASLDTPDQRLTQDLRDFCDSLSRVLKVVLAAPLRVVWYGTLGVRLVGAGSVLAAVTFFAAGSAAQAFLVKSIARLVADQERMEGTLRAAHVRLWDRREDVAMSRAQGAESAVVMRALSRAVDNQGRIVFRRWLLAAVSQILDYGGSVVNYAVIGAAVFLAPRAAGDGGDVARLVSTASFATLMLINSLTQVLGTARDCADLAGLAARVGAALRVLGLTHAHVARMGKGGKGGYANEHGTAMRAYGGWTAPRPRNSIDSVTSRDSMSRQGSLFGASPGIERRGRDGAGPGVLPGVGAPHPEACTVQPPTLFCLHDGGKASPTAMGGQRGGGASASNGSAGMEGGARAGGEASVGWSAGDAAWLPGQLEVSVHALGPPLAAVVAGVFPDAPIHSPGTLTAIVTMQCSQVELAGDGGTEVAEEMDRMLQTFFRASKAVEAVLGRLGHWSCSIDPLTGLAMRGTPGERYSEVRGARTLLGYSVNDAGPLPLLSHPVVGTRVYPATLFTTAPPDAAAAAVREALSRAPTVAYPPWPHRQAGPAIVTDAGGSGAAPVVALTGVSCALPDGRWAVRGLTVSVPAGGALLLRGPSGCGKTTLLRSLCGLRPLHSGHVALPPHDRVMFLPQRPLLAVGTGEDPGLTTLRQQVVYPLSVTASGSFDEETRVREAVEGAGLGDALARVGGDVDREARWGAAMSPGEQQRVAVARVLYHRPLVAFLDESTNALPGDAEAAVYAALRARGVAVVTVGHGASLEALHDAVVEIEGGGQGRWAMRDAGAGSSGTGHGR